MSKLGWMDVSNLSFNSLLLLEKIQVDYLDKLDIPEEDLFIALENNSADRIRKAKIEVMEHMNDWLVYVVDPEIYDNQGFLEWDSDELISVVDFNDKTVVDLGAGTGRLTFVAAEKSKSVFAVEPIGNLRNYLKKKAKRLGYDNVYPVDGLIEDIPFPDDFVDIITGGYVFGDYFDREYNELMRVLKPGGMVILCPGNNGVDNDRHEYLFSKGFKWSSFLEPGDGMKRKYWKEIEG